MKRYNPSEVEPKWQSIWADDHRYEAVDFDSRQKFYISCMFPYPSGELVQTTTKMKIGSGAILRSDPHVPDIDIDLSNKLGSLDFGDTDNTVIDTPHGVYTYDNVDGRWYGINRDDLKESSIKDSSAKLDTDRDGVIWVNEQKADPEESR